MEERTRRYSRTNYQEPPEKNIFGWASTTASRKRQKDRLAQRVESMTQLFSLFDLDEELSEKEKKKQVTIIPDDEPKPLLYDSLPLPKHTTDPRTAVPWKQSPTFYNSSELGIYVACPFYEDAERKRRGSDPAVPLTTNTTGELKGPLADKSRIPKFEPWDGTKVTTPAMEYGESPTDLHTEPSVDGKSEGGGPCGAVLQVKFVHQDGEAVESVSESVVLQKFGEKK